MHDLGLQSDIHTIHFITYLSPADKEMKHKSSSQFFSCNINNKVAAIYRGDITLFPESDVIVNAANAALKHLGGVAKAIANKGGPIVQHSSDEFISVNGNLCDGDVWLTTAVGKLPCKALIHAVGPRWNGGMNNEEAVLYNTCFNSLNAANHYNSISIPGISSGIFGFPLKTCSKVLTKAVFDFCNARQETSLKFINFILLTSEVVEDFVIEMKQLADPGNEKVIDHNELSVPHGCVM